MSDRKAEATVYPLTFEPVFKAYPWGGRRLETHLGRAIPSGKVAESWEISAHSDGPSTVCAGALAGKTLPEVVATLGTELVGSRVDPAAPFPLLVKLLDAHEWLSIQVHPDDDYACRYADDAGKTEMWIVLGADPGAELILGFNETTERLDANAIEAALTAGRLEEILHRQPVEAGDVFFVPAGLIHAIGPGVLIAEIQQSSNVTYRVFDWHRTGSGDTPRPLHLADALRVMSFDAIAPGPVTPLPLPPQPGGAQAEELVTCPYFRTERIRLGPADSYDGLCDGHTFEIWGVLDGSCRLESSPDDTALEAVSWVLLPAGLGPFSIHPQGESVLIRVTVPDSAGLH